MEKENMIKFILQHLNNSGYQDVAKKLEQETNVSLYSKNIIEIKNLVIKDKISEAIEYASKSEELNLHSVDIIKILIIYSIFTKIESKDMKTALDIARKCVKLYEDNEIILNSVKQVVILFYAKDKNFLLKKMNELSPESISKESIIKYLDSNFLDSKSSNLMKVLNIVYESEMKNCEYHNTKNTKFSYFFDHNCPKELIPTKVAISIELKEEVLNLIFSNNHKFIAAILKSHSIYIYKLNKNKREVEFNLVNILEEIHKNQITSLMWNKSNSLILTASKDKTVKLTDPFNNVVKMTIDAHDGMVSSALFVENDNKILTAGLDYKINLWSLSDFRATLVHSLHVPALTVSELLYSSIYNFVILISATTNSILIYDMATRIEIDKLQLNDVIISSAISKVDNGSYLLVNSSTATPVLNLVNLKTKIIERKYFGHRQERFSIKCSFGEKMNPLFFVALKMLMYTYGTETLLFLSSASNLISMLSILSYGLMTLSMIYLSHVVMIILSEYMSMKILKKSLINLL